MTDLIDIFLKSCDIQKEYEIFAKQDGSFYYPFVCLEGISTTSFFEILMQKARKRGADVFGVFLNKLNKIYQAKPDRGIIEVTNEESAHVKKIVNAAKIVYENQGSLSFPIVGYSELDPRLLVSSLQKLAQKRNTVVHGKLSANTNIIYNVYPSGKAIKVTTCKE